MRNFLAKTEDKETISKTEKRHFFSSAEITSKFGNGIIQRKANCSCGGGCPGCQAKSQSLAVSQPNDASEIEADHIADKVMRMSNKEFSPVKNIYFPSNNIQRKCGECEDGETIQRKRQPVSDTSASKVNSSHINDAINSGGQPLSTETKSFFEPRFGYDLSGVRIHTDEKAASSAQQINAAAYTFDQDIVFNRNRYQPDTIRGKRLMAHELAHVIQQQAGAKRKIIQRADDASFERLSGVGDGISNGTMNQETSIMGQTYTVRCSNRYNFSFKFSKAYKGDYPYRAANRDVKGVYVKIEASIHDRQYCGRCTPMRLLQVIKSIQKGSSGNIENADPVDPTRRERSGWGDSSAPSRGWRVDRLVSATNPYYTSGSNANEGDETTPAVLWDVPGDWTTTTNHGKEFYTCAICEDASNRRWVAACVQWGYYTDSSGNITFRPSTPSASCGYITQMKDASERWDNISGNTATGITF